MTKETAPRFAGIGGHHAGHRKAAANRNVDAKVRQQLQRGPYRRVAPGLWEAAR